MTVKPIKGHALRHAFYLSRHKSQAVAIHQKCPLFTGVAHRYFAVWWKISSSNIPAEIKKSKMESSPEREVAIHYKTMEIRCSVVSCTVISAADMNISSSIVRLKAFKFLAASGAGCIKGV